MVLLLCCSLPFTLHCSGAAADAAAGCWGHPAGIKGVGGATLVYRADNLRDPSSWRYVGLLCEGKGDTGGVGGCVGDGYKRVCGEPEAWGKQLLCCRGTNHHWTLHVSFAVWMGEGLLLANS